MQEIVFTSAAYDQYKTTVAKHPPETGAMLIGSLRAPNRVTAVRLLLPTALPDGSYKVGSTFFGFDRSYADFVINYELEPNGLSLLGFLHSHPAGCTRLSGGARGSVHGDIAAFTAILDLPAAQEMGIAQLLTPITTFNPDGSDQIHGWILRRGSSEPEPAEIIIEDRTDRPEALSAGQAQHTDAALKAADIIDTLLRRQHQILRRPELGFLGRLQARFLYARGTAAVIQAQLSDRGEGT
ncbi:MAG: hypothetical protein RIC85_03055 [Gammaproteobacteria bacterium]